MIIANRSIHIIDYENNRILSRDIPATFDEYVGELIEHINRNDSVRDYKTRSRYTEVISGAIAISSQKDNADVVRERTNSIANRLLVKEVEAILADLIQMFKREALFKLCFLMSKSISMYIF